MKKDVTRRYFSRLATEYGVDERSDSDKYEVIRKLMLPSSDHADILECGGGVGFYTRRFLQDGYSVTCVDLSEEALSENRKNAEMIGKGAFLTTIEGDFVSEAMNLEKKFDQIVFIKVLHHFVSLKEIYRAVDIARELCKDSGRVIIFEPNGRNILWKVFLMLWKDRSSGKSKWFYEHNMRFTTVQNFKEYLGETERRTEYRIGYHYVIPSFILNGKFIGVSILQRTNSVLEKTLLEKLAFNISIVIDT